MKIKSAFIKTFGHKIKIVIPYYFKLYQNNIQKPHETTSSYFSEKHQTDQMLGKRSHKVIDFFNE